MCGEDIQLGVCLKFTMVMMMSVPLMLVRMAVRMVAVVVASSSVLVVMSMAVRQNRKHEDPK